MDSQAAHQQASRPLQGYLPSIESLLKQVIRHGGFDLTFIIRPTQPAEDDYEAPEVVVDFSGPDSDLLLEAHATLLDALEYLLCKAVRLEEDLFGKIGFDCQDWRRVHLQELKLTAQVAAERVIETGTSYELSPMNARDRRIIHLALRESSQVRTESHGFGPERKVVIHPQKPEARSQESRVRSQKSERQS